MSEYSGERVKVFTDKPVGGQVQISINGELIPFYEADIRIRQDEFVSLTMRVPVETLDLEILQKHIEIQEMDSA